jgi:hypothetical protein
MEFPVLMEIFKLGAPRGGLTLGLLAFLGLLLFLSYKYQRLGWLNRRFPVLIPFFQMSFFTLAGIEIAIFFANLWADKLIYGKGIAITLSTLSIIVVRVYLSYWYSKYPISYKVHRM